MFDFDEAMNDLIGEVSEYVASRFPAYVSSDDVAQTLWVWALENKKSTQTLIRKSESWRPMVKATLKRVAYTYAFQEEGGVNGYSQEDAYEYTLPIVRELLKDVFSYEDWQTTGVSDGQPKAHKQVNEGNDRWAMLSDISSAVDKLNRDQWSLIISHYKHGSGLQALAETYEITPKAARERLTRAEKAVQRSLGRKTPSEMRRDFSQRLELDVRTGRLPGESAQYIAERDWNG